MIAFLGFLLFAFLSTGLFWRFAPASFLNVPNSRSLHHTPTLRGGGLALLAGILLAEISYHPLGTWLLPMVLLLGLLGMLDDYLSLKSCWRFGIQCIVASAAVTVIFSPHLNTWGVLPCFFILLWSINLYNFMDGMDGLATSQALFLVFGMMTLSHGMPSTLWHFHLGLLAILLGFLPFNWPPARLFMGDVGSTLLGFILSSLLVWHVLHGFLHPLTALILSALFWGDATITLLTRWGTGQAWYQAHRLHAYQKLCQRLHGNHFAALWRLMAMNIGFLFPLAWYAPSHPFTASTFTAMGLLAYTQYYQAGRLP